MPLVGDNGQRFESFGACVRSISGDGTTKEEAQEICGGFEEVDKDVNNAMKLIDVLHKVLSGDVFDVALDVEKEEQQDQDADPSEDDEPSDDNVVKKIDIYKTNDEQQILFGTALKADRPDLEGDVFPADDVEKAAHNFMLKSQEVFVSHEEQAPARPVESFIAPTDFTFGENEVKKGDWIVGIKIENETLWKLAKEGKIGGLSVGGRAKRIPVNES